MKLRFGELTTFAAVLMTGFAWVARRLNAPGL